MVTFNHPNEVDAMIARLKQNNIHCIEITLRTEAAFDAAQYTLEKYGAELSVGIGTVVQEKQIETAIKLGVHFMVSPGLNLSLAKIFEESKIAFIPGVATPSDIINGLQRGWDTFKFFPAHLFGGLEALKAYGKVFPQAKFCPTGGINETTYKDYLVLENIMSVGGSWMTKSL